MTFVRANGERFTIAAGLFITFSHAVQVLQWLCQNYVVCSLPLGKWADLNANLAALLQVHPDGHEHSAKAGDLLDGLTKSATNDTQAANVALLKSRCPSLCT